MNTAESLLAEIARRQHGLVTREQAVRAGLTEGELKHRVRVGALIRVHQGVYRVGHAAPSLEATYLAAVLACGGDAAVSGPAAAHLLGILRGRAPAPEITARLQHRVRGVKMKRDRSFAARDRTFVRGIPVTTPARTLVDLAAILPGPALAAACHEAGVRHRTTPRQVGAVLARKPNAKGAGTLRAVMSGDEKVLLSRVEAAFLSLLEEENLPLPETNTRAGGRRVDCRWPEQRLTVELDGYAVHSSRHAWERDRARERAARARGDEHRRYTWYDVTKGRATTARDLRRRLATSPRSS